MTTKTHDISWLPTSACGEARQWVREQNQSPEECWNLCQRPDWLLWLASELQVSERLIREAGCDIAETVIDNVEPDSMLACVWAIDAARRFERGECDAEERSAAESAARSAAESAARSAAESAAENAAESAAWSAAWSAAESAAENAAESAAESAACDLIRARIPWALLSARLEGKGS